jgi:hypothetical protein
MDPLLLGTAAAFGLAASAGLNTTLPLLIVGVLARAGLLTLGAPFDALASDVALIGLLLLAALEISADKIPGFDSVAQAIQFPLAAAAGAILFASQTSVVTSVSPGLAILVGLLTAGTVHGVRTAFRPAVTASTFGVGNPGVSLLEDVFAVTLVAASVLWPWLAVLLLLLLAIVVVTGSLWAVRKGLAFSRWTRGRAGSQQVGTP